LLDIEEQRIGSFDPARSAANAARTEYVDIGGTRYAYRRFGRRSPVALVLLQRYRGTMDDWDPLFLDLIAGKRELILLDYAGVGLSTGQAPESIVGMARDVAAFLDRLALGQTDVLGWSLGGCVAQQLTLDRPDLVRRLVLAATGPGGVENAPGTPPRVFHTMLKPVNDQEDFLYLFFPETDRGRNAGLAHLRRLGLRREEPAPLVRSESFKAQLAAIRSFTTGVTATLPHLGRIEQPVLVANGYADVMIPAYNSWVMAQRLPDALLMLYPSSGHGFLFEQAEHFSRQVLDFLAP